jgi:hypothetical protein
MVDIVVGRIPPMNRVDSGKQPDMRPIEAQILNVRAPRQRQRQRPDRTPNRRRDKTHADPPGSRVLVLLVPEAHRLPDDLDEGNYRILLRIVRH